MWNVVLQVVRKDLARFVADKRALVISFAVPVVIASFFGLMNRSLEDQPTPKNLGFLVVDEDRSAASARMLKNLKAGGVLEPKVVSMEEAKDQVGKGKSASAMVIPKGFFASAVAAMTGGPRPELPFLTDPTQKMLSMTVRGSAVESVMKSVTQSTFGDAAPGGGSLPFEMKDLPQTAEGATKWSGVAHAFAGMAVQGVFFWSIEAAMVLLRERKLGIWNRQKAAPVSSAVLLTGTLISSAIRAAMIIGVVFSFGALVFGVHVSLLPGFLLVAMGTAFLSASFGMFVASMGKTEEQSRGLSILAVLTMMMLGGAWFPMEMMPTWIQAISKVIPARWAVSGFDDMTWRGGDILTALTSTGVLIGFTVLLTGIAMRRLRYEAEAA